MEQVLLSAESSRGSFSDSSNEALLLTCDGASTAVCQPMVCMALGQEEE